MVQGKANLVVDLGNSETRVLTMFGVTQKGDRRHRLSILDNRYADVPNDYKVSDDYSEENTTIFYMDNGYWCNGKLCEDEFSVFAIRPTAQEKKYESDVTRLTLRRAFLQGLMDLSDIANAGISALDVDWDVTVLLPPGDLGAGAAKIADMVKEIKGIRFVMPEVEKEIKINSVKVMPEGFCAFISVLMDLNSDVREDYKYLLEGSTLLFDIGAGTTDIVVVKDGHPIDNTRTTVEIGGNNVHQKVRNLLREKYDLTLPERTVRVGVERGFVKDGSKRIDLVDMIADAQNDVAKTFISEAKSFFERTQYPVRTIENLLICGGGAEESKVDGVEPIGRYLFEYMKRLSPNISNVELPCGKDGEKVSPRLLNIYGAGTLSK